MSAERELFQFWIFSFAKYRDGDGFHIHRLNYGKRICDRWAVDFGLYRLRIEFNLLAEVR